MCAAKPLQKRKNSKAKAEAVETSTLQERQEELTEIRVRGAREHNLKNISADIPRDSLVVITGLSGSGKSSLAFDTIYAEGQRRYVECLSPYARQFLGMMRKPDIDSVEGLSPAISIEQKSVGSNPRSTVGTVTEIYDYLRLLFARVGVQYCVNCDIPVQSQTAEQIIDAIQEIPQETRIMILAPLVKGRKGHYRELFETLMKQGYTKARIDGEIKEITHGMMLSRFQKHDVELVVDRLSISPEQEKRLAESVAVALRMGENIVTVLHEEQENQWSERMYSTLNSCPSCGTSYEPLAPNNFSFNSPYGACSTCEGTGVITDFDEELIMPNKNLSIEDGGIAILGKKRKMWQWEKVTAFAKETQIDLSISLKDLPNDQLQALLWGTKKKKITVKYVTASGKELEYQTRFNGILSFYREQFDQTTSSDIRSNIEKYMSGQLCPDCNGGRLKPENLAVKIADRNISDTTRMDIAQAVTYFQEMEKQLNARQKKIGHLVIKEIISRLEFLENVGLHYLQLNRSARTLSGGESQRIRLASQIGSQLVGVTYVLDEPSIGLHQHDNDKLINSLKKLRDTGNTVVVVEHDREMIEQADYILDIGPGAGIHGGEIMYQGKPEQLLSETADNGKSITAQYLTGEKEIEIPEERRIGNGNYLTLYGAYGNNLKNVDVSIPLGTFVCITGMSGSGKSSLINYTLYPMLARHFHNSLEVPLPHESIEGLEFIDKVIEIDQKPIGRTPRSNPATYTGVFTQIRELFAQLPESRIRGYEQGRFSFNVKGGRCEECGGGGMKTIEMNYLPEVLVECEICGGKRYNSETLQVEYKGKSIADILDMSISDAVELFAENPKVNKKLQVLENVGLGYIKLGQQAPTLSGGEAQRVKLATELSKVQTGRTMYLLDEPTTGLHFEDIRLLLKILADLVEKGNTVVVIEHNLDVIKVADWIIDIGPTGGAGGGKIVAQGTPENICKVKESITGKYLKKELERK